MMKEFISRFRRPLRILLNLSVLLVGLCLMGGCLYLYHFGPAQPFSRESVAGVFRFVAIPVFLCLFLWAVSIPAKALLFGAEEAPVPSRPVRMSLHRLQQRTDLEKCGKELRLQVLALRSDRRLFDGITRTAIFLSGALFLSYALNGKNFHASHISTSMIRAMFWLLPCVLVPLGFGIFTARRNYDSMKQELELLKSAPRDSRIAPVRPASRHRRILVLRTVLLVLGLVMLLCGLFSGGTADLLTKAVNICTECIGLG